jgi:hypothetical protein
MRPSGRVQPLCPDCLNVDAFVQLEGFSEPCDVWVWWESPSIAGGGSKSATSEQVRNSSPESPPLDMIKDPLGGMVGGCWGIGRWMDAVESPLFNVSLLLPMCP